MSSYIYKIYLHKIICRISESKFLEKMSDLTVLFTLLLTVYSPVVFRYFLYFYEVIFTKCWNLNVQGCNLKHLLVLFREYSIYDFSLIYIVMYVFKTHQYMILVVTSESSYYVNVFVLNERDTCDLR
jgi:hypothetical protein